MRFKRVADLDTTEPGASADPLRQGGLQVTGLDGAVEQDLPVGKIRK